MPTDRPDIRAATVTTPQVGCTYHIVADKRVNLGWKLVAVEGDVAIVTKHHGGASTSHPPRRRVPLSALRHTRAGMPKSQRGPRREDLRRLPLVAQVSRIRQYHQDKIKHQGHCGMDDPYITTENVSKRFRVVCPEGLLRAYAREEAVKPSRRRLRWILLDDSMPSTEPA